MLDGQVAIEGGAPVITKAATLEVPHAKSIPKPVEAKKAVFTEADLPKIDGRDALRQIAEGNEPKNTENAGAKEKLVLTSQLAESEQHYIDQNKKMIGLEGRYNDDRTKADYLQKQIETFAQNSGLQHESMPELEDKSFDRDNQKAIMERVQTHIDRLFNSEKGRLNPEKQRMVTEQTRRYLELITQAQGEGDLPQNLDAQTVLRLIEDNVWTLAYQDRVASENLLGDHGIRHIVDYNIQACEAIGDELIRNGQQVKAIDRLIQHQIMIDHDIGYATDTVRNAINRGSFGEDRGHNALAAKYVSEKIKLPDDSMRKVFSDEQLKIIHEGILHHDSSEINFHIGDMSNEARQDNILSAIHIADNTHAFEDKLPELLYTYPDSLRIMRLMKTAGELGDAEIFSGLQGQLVEGIQANPNLSKDDREALVHASQSLNPESYKFSVGRICGNKPEFVLNNEGKISITVQESSIHQEVVGLYGQQSYDQLKKFVADLTGKEKKDVDLNQERIVSSNGKLEIRTKTGERRAGQEELTDYQQQIDKLISDRSFQGFIIGDGTENMGDARLSSIQLNLQQELKNIPEGSETRQQIIQRLEQIKTERKTNLQKYLTEKH